MQLHDEVKELVILVRVQEPNDIGVLHIPEHVNLHRDQPQFWILGPSMHGDLFPKDKLDRDFSLIHIPGGRDHESKAAGTQFVPERVLGQELGLEDMMGQLTGRDGEFAIMVTVGGGGRVIAVGRRGAVGEDGCGWGRQGRS